MNTIIHSLVHRALFPSVGASVSMDFLYKKVAQQWDGFYSSTIFTPLTYLHKIPSPALVRAEPFIRLIYDSGVIQHGAATRVARLVSMIDEYRCDRKKTWGQTFDFVKKELGEMNSFLPVSKIPHVAEEELPSTTFALADTLEELPTSSSSVDWEDLVERESQNFTSAYRHRFVARFGEQAQNLLSH